MLSEFIVALMGGMIHEYSMYSSSLEAALLSRLRTWYMRRKFGSWQLCCAVAMWRVLMEWTPALGTVCTCPAIVMVCC
jgi:hypothetical protein